MIILRQVTYVLRVEYIQLIVYKKIVKNRHVPSLYIYFL